jgi:capsular exopolysaccharide synthesis family protein
VVGEPEPLSSRTSETPGRSGEGTLMFLQYLLRVFSTRIWALGTVAVVILAGTFWITKREVPVYRATAQILIEREYTNLRSLEAPMNINTDEIDYYNSQYKILQGPAMALRVVKALKLDQRPDFGDSALDTLLNGLTIDFTRYNRVYEISYEHTEPEFAAKVVNTLVEEYQKWTVERRHEMILKLHREMYDELEKVKQELDACERDLLEFYSKHGLLQSEERQSSFQRMFDEASLRLLTEEQELGRLNVLARQIQEAGDDVTRIRSVILGERNFWDDDLMVADARAREELADVAKRHGPSHALYQSAAARVQELEKKVNAEILVFARSVLSSRDAKRLTVEQTRTTYDDLRKKRLDNDRLLAEAEVRRRNRDANRQLYDALSLRVKESRISSELGMTNVYTLSPAVPPRGAVRPDLWSNMSLGLIFALVAGALVTLLLDRIDNRVRTPEDVEDNYHLPILSVVPMARLDSLRGPAATICLHDEHSLMAEAFRRVRAAIMLSVRREGGPLRRIVVCSAGAGEGKTVTASNLAISLAQMGERTLLIDSDFYRSTAHKLFNLDREKGLSTILVSDVTLPQVVQPTGLPHLDFLATGLIPPQPATLLGSARMNWLLDEASRAYSRIVVDTAPLVAVTDASLLAPQADAVVVVVSQGRTVRGALRRAIQNLTRIGIRPLGFVFNGVRSSSGEFYMPYRPPVERVAEERESGTSIRS